MKTYIVYISLLMTIMCQADNMKNAFVGIYHNNTWGNNESVSGSGSTLWQTETLRRKFESLLDLLDIETILDAACGDFNWFKTIQYPFKRYFGVDIVPELIRRNTAQYGTEAILFECKNIVYDALPKVDLIICRDCLVHLKFNDIKAALRNFKKSGSKYILTTTFTKKRPITEVPYYGDWITLNLELAPFNLPTPILYLNEHCPIEGFDDKCLGLWELADLDI